MQHRHLNHQDFTLAAVDDIIRHGGSGDWVLLRRAAHRDAAVLARVRRICGTAAASQPQEGSQRLNFWKIDKKTQGVRLIHHTQKIQSTQNQDFDSVSFSGKCGSGNCLGITNYRHPSNRLYF